MLKLTKPPYADTEVDAEKTQQDITQLLRKYGVSQINWQIDYDMEQVQLDFVIEYMKQEDQTTHRIAVRVKPPMFAAKRRTWDPKLGRYKKEEMANWEQFRGNIAEYRRSFRAASDFIDFHGSLTIEDIYFFGQKEKFLRMFAAQGDYNVLPSWDDPKEVRK